MKIYTKTGDKGQTSLLSGKRVDKNHLRIESYGTIDELNSWIGLIKDGADEGYDVQLTSIQNELFTIGSQLANDPDNKYEIPDLNFESITRLENEIDAMSENLSEMRNFILPGGHTLVSHAHIARCVCRRAERRMVELEKEVEIKPHLIKYINRLSDYLFILSREFSRVKKAKEIPWVSS